MSIFGGNGCERPFAKGLSRSLKAGSLLCTFALKRVFDEDLFYKGLPNVPLP